MTKVETMQYPSAAVATVSNRSDGRPISFGEVEEHEVRRALAHLLASAQFAKAQRMSRLIKFLIEAELGNAPSPVNEYVVGIDVFDRDARTYSTCEDPIVRVQMGRLRDRLEAYYLQAGAASFIRFAVPLRSYRAIIIGSRPEQGRIADLDVMPLIAVSPLISCNEGELCLAFTRGLNEELAYRLSKAFLDRIAPLPASVPEAGRPSCIKYLLEGSVRFSGSLTRTSMRMIDSGSSRIVWTEQFDHLGNSDIAAQEHLAVTICCSLKEYFCRSHAHDICA